MMTTDLDLSWVTFMKQDNSQQCEGFDENLHQCPNEAVWIVYAETECPECQKSLVCQPCFEETMHYANTCGLMCEHEIEVEVTHWERIPR